MSLDQPSDVLLIHDRNRVRTLTLNRPDARNALSAELRSRLFESLAHADRDDSVHVVVLTGADPAFCAGLDTRELKTKLPELSEGWPPMSKPVIGAVNGPAATGGLEIALSCDILIASERAAFADTHARVGILPMWGMSVRLPQLIGFANARRMALAAEFITADQALGMGLVSQVVPHDELLATVQSLAETIAANDQRTVRTLLAASRQIETARDHHASVIERATALEWLYERTATNSAPTR